MMTKTIEVLNLAKNFNIIKAVNDISFTTEEGDIIAVLGANGAGKSTLMNMLAGILSPDNGKIIMFGKNMEDAPLFMKKNIGFLPEGSPLYSDMKVKDFLYYIAELKGVKKEKIAELAKDFRIDSVMNQRIENLSKGYARRVGFAQAMIADPKILLLDEPTDGLDPNQKEHIRKIIKQISPSKTILISTHLLDDVSTMCNRVILIDKGKLIEDTDTKQLLEKTNTKSLDAAFKILTKGKEQ